MRVRRSSLLVLVTTFGCAAPPSADSPSRPVVSAEEAAPPACASCASSSPAPVDAGADASDAAGPVMPHTAHPTSQAHRTPGDGPCQSAADCVIGDAVGRCDSRSCARVARTREAQKRFERDLARRCGGTPADRMPCPIPAPTEVVCEDHRCVLLEADLF